MAGIFSLRKFTDINLEDPFFDSLKSDYQGSVKTAEFNTWFNNKAREGRTALVFDDDEGLGAFIAIKPEAECINLDETTLPQKSRLKICTFLIAPRFRGQRLGEGALGLVLWKWQEYGFDEIYVTIFDSHQDLIAQLKKFGFHIVGHRDGESVYLKDRNHIDYSDPYKSFPFIDSNFDEAGYLAIKDEYHDTLFPYSELKRNNLPQKILDVSNGLSKIYIGSPTSKLGFHAGDPVFIYRKYTGSLPKGYNSCVTSFCMVKDITWIKKNGKSNLGFTEYLNIIGNKSIYNPGQLKKMYEQSVSLVIIELVYYGFFGGGNNINWVWLKENGCWANNYPTSQKLSHEQFTKILKKGKIDVNNIIINAH